MATPHFLYVRLTQRLDVLIKGRLWLQVLVALAAGALVGFLLGPDLAWVSRGTAEMIGDWLALPGKLFLALIGMVIIPLAASSIVLGIAGSGGGEAMKAVGRRLALFILATTVLAAAIGVALARAIRPGRRGAEAAGALPVAPPPSLKPDLSVLPEPPVSGIQGFTRELPDMIVGLIPQNITASLMERDMLAIVVFSLLVGIAVVGAEKRELTRPIVALSEAVLEVSMTVIRTAMRFAPLAVFGLIAHTTLTNGVSTLIDLALYCAVVLSGLFVLQLVYLLLVTTAGAISPIAFMRMTGPVQLLAFSTSSSAAVMPLTMKTAVDKLSVPPALAGAVVPLAATVNMAGTALYQAAAIVFLADLAQITLSVGDLALIMITLTGASIGAPAAPGASIAILSATATSFGVPLTGLPLVMGVDRILDMARTAVNVTGDLVLCRILARGHPATVPGKAPAAAPAEAAPAAAAAEPATSPS